MALSRKTTLCLVIPKVLIAGAAVGGIFGARIAYRNSQLAEYTKDYQHDEKGTRTLLSATEYAEKWCRENSLK